MEIVPYEAGAVARLAEKGWAAKKNKQTGRHQFCRILNSRSEEAANGVQQQFRKRTKMGTENAKIGAKHKKHPKSGRKFAARTAIAKKSLRQKIALNAPIYI